MNGRSCAGATVWYRRLPRLPEPTKGGERSVQTGRDRPFRMGGEHMRRRLLSLFALAVLSASLVGPAVAADSVTLQLGSTFTVTGRTGSEKGKHIRAVGKVVVSGRWGTGRWHILTTTQTDQAGNYVFRLKPHRRGNLTVRIVPPDHHPRSFVLHIY